MLTVFFITLIKKLEDVAKGCLYAYVRNTSFLYGVYEICFSVKTEGNLSQQLRDFKICSNKKGWDNIKSCIKKGD